MCWTTIYIKGKNGFREALRNKLDDSWLSGTIDSKQNLVMYWLSATNNLQEFKRTIGSKTIFKFRLQFFTNLDEYNQSARDQRTTQLTAKEEAMIAEMKAWEIALSKRRSDGRPTLDRHLIKIIANSRNDN